MLASQIMSTDLFTVDENENFNYVEVCSDIRHIRHIPVTNKENEIIGIVSVRDLLGHITKGAPSYFAPIQEIMARDVITAQKDDSVYQVATLMQEHDISAVPIVDGKKLVGIITERDFVKLYKDEDHLDS